MINIYKEWSKALEDVEKWRNRMPDWLKLGITTATVLIGAIWYAGAQQATVNKRLDALEEVQRQSGPENIMILEKLGSIQRSLVEIETYLHYNNEKNDFPLPQVSIR